MMDVSNTTPKRIRTRTQPPNKTLPTPTLLSPATVAAASFELAFRLRAAFDIFGSSRAAVVNVCPIVTGAGGGAYTYTYCTEIACAWVVERESGWEGSGYNEGDRDEDCDEVYAHGEGLNR
jgi:hypothetical protein